MLDDKDRAEIERTGAGLLILYIFVTTIFLAATILSLRQLVNEFR